VVAVIGLIALSVISFIVSAAIAGSDNTKCGYNSSGVYRCTGGGRTIGLFFVEWIVTVVVTVFVLYLVQLMLIRGALMITYGQKIEMKALLSTEDLPQYLLASILVAVAMTVLCCFNFVIFFFAQFFGFFIVDKKMSAVDAIKSSFQLVNRNLGTLIGFTIGVIIAFVIGAAVCGLGLIVAFPVVTIATAFMYRRLQGEPVAA
jgi:uncharacterized membrane protein